MRSPAVEAEELKRKVQNVWDDTSKSENEKLKFTFDKYIEMRTSVLNLEQQALAKEALGNVQVDVNPNVSSWLTGTKKITIGENLNSEPLARYSTLTHEFEHLTQFGGTNSEAVYAKAYKEMVDKSLQRPTAPVSRLQAEFEAIGAQWDFLQAMPESVRKEALQKIENHPGIADSTKLMLKADIEKSTLTREEFVKQVPSYHGYTSYDDLRQRRISIVSWLGVFTAPSGLATTLFMLKPDGRSR